MSVAGKTITTTSLMHKEFSCCSTLHTAPFILDANSSARCRLDFAFVAGTPSYFSSFVRMAPFDNNVVDGFGGTPSGCHFIRLPKFCSKGFSLLSLVLHLMTSVWRSVHREVFSRLLEAVMNY